MFTGIVEEIGEVVAVTERDEVVELRIAGRTVSADAAPGDSIAVSGVCLTVVEVAPGERFSVELVPETLRRSSLAGVAAGAMAAAAEQMRDSGDFSALRTRLPVDGWLDA